MTGRAGEHPASEPTDENQGRSDGNHRELLDELLTVRRHRHAIEEQWGRSLLAAIAESDRASARHRLRSELDDALVQVASEIVRAMTLLRHLSPPDPIVSATVSRHLSAAARAMGSAEMHWAVLQTFAE